MESVREFVSKVATTWRAVGVALAALAGAGLIFPNWLDVLTSDETITSVVQIAELFIVAVGGAIAAWNDLRKRLANEPDEGEESEPTMIQLSATDKKKYRGPFGKAA